MAGICVASNHGFSWHALNASSSAGEGREKEGRRHPFNTRLGIQKAFKVLHPWDYDHEYVFYKSSVSFQGPSFPTAVESGSIPQSPATSLLVTLCLDRFDSLFPLS